VLVTFLMTLVFDGVDLVPEDFHLAGPAKEGDEAG
jgi:hypothetical protein